MKTVRWFALLAAATVPASTALSATALATPSENADVVVISQATVDGVDYNTREFPRCVNWQHWGPGEYVTALEPANGSVEGRWTDRERGVLDRLDPGARKTYRYRIRVLSDRAGLDELATLNGPPR